jgi:hypothetical protein
MRGMLLRALRVLERCCHPPRWLERRMRGLYDLLVVLVQLPKFDKCALLVSQFIIVGCRYNPINLILPSE